ncbi:MAG: O-antigen ligase family protein, partial [Bacteroidota bacterium]
FAWLFIRTCLMLRHYYPERPLRFSRLFTSSVFAIMAVFIIGMYVNPDDIYRLTHGGEEARLGGFMMNPNELGMLAVVGLGSCLMELYQGQRKIPLLLMGTVMLLALVMTGSRSSMISFLAIAFFFITKSKYNWLKPALFAGGFLAIPVIVNTIFIKQGDLEEVLSMTGRLPFWTALLTEGLPKEPWMGYGYMRIAWTEMFQSVNTYAGKMTHNTFIQVLMNLGFIGFGTVLAQLTATLRGWIRNPNKLDRMFFLAVFIPILVNSFTEFGIFGEANFGILFYQILIFLVVLRPGERLTAVQRMQLQRLRPEFTLNRQPI